MTITIPADIDQDLTERLEISATNRAGGSEVPLMINIHHVSAPTWQPLPAQNLRPGASINLDLNAYLNGIPTPTIAFNPAPSGDIADATLDEGILTWTVPATITTDTSLPFTL